MKKMIVVATVFFGVFQSAVACPNMSGKFSWDLRPEDGRKLYTFRITQSGCDSVTFSDWRVEWKKGGPAYQAPSSSSRTELIDGVFRERFKYSWTADGVEVIQKDFTSEGCQEHGFWKISDYRNVLDYIWRFECPKGNSEWLTPDTKQGWTGDRHHRIPDSF